LPDELELDWRGKQVLAQIRKGEASAVGAAAGLVFDASQKRVPVDTGKLKASGRVEVDEENATATISYGKGLPDYRAVAEHEKTEYKHEHGQAKYLEGPLNELKKQALGAIAADLKKKLGFK
jgi:hypothetical protein